MPSRIRTFRKRYVAPLMPSNVPKIFLVGPNVEQISSFVNYLKGEDSQHDPLGQHPLFNVGLQLEIVKFQNKTYDLWNANSSKEEHLALWGVNSTFILLFGEDQTWYNRMKNMYPNTPIKIYNPLSIISNLEM
jgi:hypothetical protein